jgi:predicted anti-sigma-YlaC factor YlaD
MAERVTDYLEGTLSLGSRLGTRAHLFQCSSCRRYFKQMRKTIGLLADAPPSDPPPGTADRIIGELRRRPPGQQAGE